MPLPFYRESNSKCHAEKPQSDSSCTSYLGMARIFKTKIPARLSFEEIVRDTTHSPCSLDDFIDYLVYVEHSAENLQFFMWYCRYVEKWGQLSEEDRERSSVWRLSQKTYIRPQSSPAKFQDGMDRLNRILTILDQASSSTSRRVQSINEPGSNENRAGVNFSRPRTPARALEVKEEAQKEWQWQPFSVQPFRDEVTQIALHYILTRGPRSLNLTCWDRTACMHALQHTTHPSAFLPAFLAAETALREHSHPNFIHWSTRNSNRPRVVFARFLGVVLVFLAFALDVLLILSKVHRLYRLSALPPWYIGLYVLLIEGRGISIRLYMNRKRQLRPWEGDLDLDVESKQQKARPEQTESGNAAMAPEDQRQDNAAQVGPPVNNERLLALGPANDFETEPWVQSYQDKSVWQKVFDKSVSSRNRHLRALQDRAIFTSLLWAGLLVVVLTVGSVLIPSGNFF
ncbi:hypothetical protein M426DRAFT_263194 [Hypoxylon sp. CI-4A]|nr:hypothetical protein M426DRAFT_263194 [Hypoxylon sp. CI-4A]